MKPWLPKLAFSASVFAAATFTAQLAQANENRFYISPMGSYLAEDNDRSAQSGGFGGHLGIGKFLNSYIALELNAFGARAETPDNERDLTLFGYGINALGFPGGRERGFYGVVGYGYHKTRGEDGGMDIRESNDMAELGMGFLYDLTTKGTALRGDVRTRIDMQNGQTHHDTYASVGFLMPFGQADGDISFPNYDGEFDGRFYLSLMGSYLDSDRDRHIIDIDNTAPDNNPARDARSSEDDIGFQIAIGKHLTQAISAEIRAYRHKIEHGDVDQTIQGWAVDFPIFFHRTPRFSPYMVLGVGRQDNEFETTGIQTKSDGTNADLGFGFTTALIDQGFGVRFDVRYRYTHQDTNHIANTGDFHDGIVNLGLHIPFGPAPVPPDTDGDGVFDRDDNCPGTPPGTPVDSLGCPLDTDGDGVIDPNDTCPGTPPGTPVDNRGCPLDSDGDGVPDNDDACPGTPPGTPVDGRGCPFEKEEEPEPEPAAPDSDGDGVPDADDQCPDTVAGMKVDDDGCVIPQNFILKGVFFEFDSAQLTPNSQSILDDVAKALAGQPTIRAEVAGHTDWKGPSDYNLDLSQRRADSVKQYLTDKGTDGDRLETRGYGESKPIADNTTADGRAQNRRVELNVLK